MVSYMQINIHEAKSSLSSLIEKVLSGEEVIIAKAGKPVAKLEPFEKNYSVKMGAWKDKNIVFDEEKFNEPIEGFSEYF